MLLEPSTSEMPPNEPPSLASKPPPSALHEVVWVGPGSADRRPASDGFGRHRREAHLLQPGRGPLLGRIERVATLGQQSVKLGAERHAARRMWRWLATVRCSKRALRS